MPADEGDSGIEAVSTPDSREASPKSSMRSGKSALDSVSDNSSSRKAILGDDDDLVETLSERLWGLTEMFPESVRNAAWWASVKSVNSAKSVYSFSRSAAWIFFSSSAIMFAPLMFEMERMHMDDMNKQQQRQILLGPSAAVGGGGLMPPGMAPAPR